MTLTSPELSRRAWVAGAAALPARTQPRTATELRDYGKGRAVFTAVGHTAMWNPQYLQLQKRSIRWLLKDLS